MPLVTESNDQKQILSGQRKITQLYDPNASSSRSDLERWFDEAQFPDVREAAVDYGSLWIDEFYGKADEAARWLSGHWRTPEQGLEFIEMTLRGAFTASGASERSQWHLKHSFWASRVVAIFPEADAIEALRRLRDLRLKLEGHGGADHVRLAVQHFPDSSGTKGFVRDYLRSHSGHIGTGDITFRREGRHIAKWLNDQFEDAPVDTWPLVRAFWLILPSAPVDELERMCRLCRNEPDFEAFALSVVETLSKASIVDAHMLWTFLDVCASRIPKDRLIKFATAEEPYAASAGLFWLCALHRSDTTTLETALDVSTRHKEAWCRQFAFALVFSHYFDMPKAAGRLVKAAYARNEDRKFNTQVLTGNRSYSLPINGLPNALEIRHRVNTTRCARTFDKICSKAGLDSGVTIPNDEQRSMLEFIDAFLSGELPKSLVNAMVWATLSKSERATYRDALKREKLKKVRLRDLKRLDPDDASGIAAWLDASFEVALTRSGFWGNTSIGLIDMALDHLSPAAEGEEADRLRQMRVDYDAIEQNVELLWRDPVNNALRRKHKRVESEIKERAFHRLAEDHNEDAETAVLAALDDAVAASKGG